MDSGQNSSVSDAHTRDPDASPTDLAEDGFPTRGGRLGRYLVLDRIGQGGMGVVFAAYDPGLDRKIALKLIRAEYRYREGASRAPPGGADDGAARAPQRPRGPRRGDLRRRGLHRHGVGLGGDAHDLARGAAEERD